VKGMFGVEKNEKKEIKIKRNKLVRIHCVGESEVTNHTDVIIGNKLRR
jgi:hypothetical protein